MLALDAAARLDVRRVLLWQPFMSGRACINRFLRLSEQLQDPAPGAPRSTAALRAQLAVQGAIEVGGFELAVPLVKAIDVCDAAHIALSRCAVHWCAHGGPAPSKLAAGAARLGERWAEAGADLHFHPLDGSPLWTGPGELDLPDGNDLIGIVDVPERPLARGMLILADSTQTRSGSHRQFTLLSRLLAARGVDVMRFDRAGAGDSDGQAATYGL